MNYQFAGLRRMMLRQDFTGFQIKDVKGLLLLLLLPLALSLSCIILANGHRRNLKYPPGTRLIMDRLN